MGLLSGIGSALSGGLSGFALSGGNPWGAAAGALGGAFSASGAARQQRDSVNMAREQMDFQGKQVKAARRYNTKMSNTAHQRQVADLRAAGLNPILSANKGASSPSSPAAGGAMGTSQNIAGAAQTAALNMAMGAANIKNIQANTALTTAQKDAITPVSSVGKEVGSAYQYFKRGGIANDLKLIKDYHFPKTSGATAHKIGSRPGKNLDLSKVPDKSNIIGQFKGRGGKTQDLYRIKSPPGSSRKYSYSLNGIEYDSLENIKKQIRN